MPSDSQDDRELIRSRVLLEEILPDYNVQLLASGRKFKALCPFHQEKTPSFWIDPDKQLYYCYGCQAGGDVFRFVQEAERVEFREALEILAHRAGVVLSRRGGRGRGEERQAIYDAMELAAAFYHHLLLSDPRAEIAREYLRARGIREEAWERFRLGYSLPEWDGLLRHLESRARGESVANRTQRGPEQEAADLVRWERAGLVRRKEGSPNARAHDYFRGRLMFPIGDGQGRTIGFGARTLGDDVPKYLNTPATPIFDKSHVLYGLSQAKLAIQKERRLAIVEGYTDAIVAHQEGLDWFVASLGTAFTAENAKMLRRLAPRVTLVFDGDAAGQSATERSLELLVGSELEVDVYSVTDGKDPCDALLALGRAGFCERLEKEAKSLFEFKWQRTVGAAEASGASPQAQATALDEFLALIALVPNEVAQRLVLREFVERLERHGIRADDIDARLRRAKSEVARAAARTGSASSRVAPGLARPGRVERSAGSPAETAERREPTPEERRTERSRRERLLGVLEALLSLSSESQEIWDACPPALFEGALGGALRMGIEKELAGHGALEGSRLARELAVAADAGAGALGPGAPADASEPDFTAASELVHALVSRLAVEGAEEPDAKEAQARWLSVRRDLARFDGRRRPAASFHEERRRLLAEALEAETGGDREAAARLRAEARRLAHSTKARGSIPAI